MENPRGIPFFLVGLFLASASAQVPRLSAQEVERETVPLELVRAVMWSSADFMVGTLPEGMRDIFPIPESAEILGSVVRPGSSTGVVRVDAEPGELRARWVEHLRESGWRPVSFGPFGGGFQATPPGGDGFCHGDSTLVNLDVEVREGGSLVRIVRQSHVEGSPGMNPCRAAMRGPLRRIGASAPVPDLLSPDDARTTATGGGGGSDEWRGYARLTSDLPVPALLDHYGDQLVDQDWTAVERTAGRTMAALAVTVVDPEGGEWRGVLTASRSGPEDQALVWLDLARVLGAR